MIDRLLLSSKEIIERAIKDYQPYAIVLMLSGGDDSMTALHVAKQLNIKIDFIMHGVTGTGIEETHDFVKTVVGREDCRYIEANAGSAFADYVLRKGFFGTGPQAHAFSYHLLKWTHFRREVSVQIRHKKRNRNILFVNGARRMESDNRRKTMIYPVKTIGSNVWVNIINEWPDHATVDFLEGNSIERNPVSKILCTSGECGCGTMLTPGDAVERGFHFPKWRAWYDDISNAVKERGFTWGWGEPMPKSIAMERKGQMNLFQPMCSGCKVNYQKSNEVKHGS
jgi:3'-phosphoadenosine 5'-phosphosulfate sulfotransferase (PAPS reductase)/FAD synthetase